MRYILVGAGILLAVACGKDKPATKPSIKIKSVSTSEVAPQQGLRIVLEFTDKEGDVSDSLFVKRDRLNTIAPDGGVSARLTDSFFLIVPDFPEKSRGEITLNLEYENGVKDAIKARVINNVVIPDSIQFRFALQDKAGHTSDTIKTEQIVVQRTD